MGTRNVEGGGRASGVQDGTMVGVAMEHWWGAVGPLGGGGDKAGTPIGGDALFRAWGTHAPRPPMVKDATSTGSLAQTFLRKAAIPGRVGEEGHPCR